MTRYFQPSESIWDSLCARPSDDNTVIREDVRSIIDRVAKYGDKALKELALDLDSIQIETPVVSEEQIKEGVTATPADLKVAIESAAANIRKFHLAQMPHELIIETAPGVKCIQRPVAIERIGIYIPGGTAPLFSTVLMLAIPARIAGCKEVILCTPAGKDGKPAPAVLFAAKLCGIDKIFRIGGAQAIAAMAYGTESVPKVDKIFGPGNQYVTNAKQILGGHIVAIDMPAGPSEVMVIADETANPSFVAADLLSQAEHGKDSQVILLCRSNRTADDVEAEVKRQVTLLGRRQIALAALKKSRIIILNNENDMIRFANLYAPEHLIVSTEKPWNIADRINNAGSIFVGNFTPESAGDYASGTNHTLPTSAWAHSFSGINMDSFIKKITIQEISEEGLRGLSSVIVPMAEAEGLQAHANAVKVRNTWNLL